MQCPNCKTTYDFGNKCPRCKVDTVLYRRTVRLSDKLYNQGLEKLKVLDFTHAIDFLSKSVAINKNNIIARNLLGLALFEIGHVGEALMHWVISSSLQEEDNPAEGYLDRVNRNSRTLEKMNDAVTMYNHALGHIKQKSDDLAIIQLKKAVENNPRFIDALNLLALCHMIQNDKDRALTVVERVLSIDAQNPIARSYYSMLNPKGRATKSVTAPMKFAPKAPDNAGPYRSINISDKKSTNFHIAEILAFVIGAVSAVAIIYFLLFPAFQSEHENEIASMKRNAELAEAAHREEIESIMADKDDLHAEIENRDVTIQNLQDAVELQARINSVHHAYSLYQANQLQESIDVLDNLDTTGMDFYVLNRIDDIRESAYPRLATLYLEAGRGAHTDGDFYKAVIDLQLAYRFMAEDINNQRRDLWSLLGESYYNIGMFEEALELLTLLRDNFPQHRPQTTARMLRSIEDGL